MRKPNKIHTTKKGNQIQCHTLFPDLLYKCVTNAIKHHVFKRKNKNMHILTVSIFFVKCVVARSLKAFLS